MQCIFFETDKNCSAAYRSFWATDETAIKELCQTSKFNECPRYRAFMDLESRKNSLKVITK